jgi:uncharacterized protein (DUF952 family)
VAELKYEVPATPDDERPRTPFPHIHGALNLDAVAATIEFPCEVDGSFKLPASIRDLPSD